MFVTWKICFSSMKDMDRILPSSSFEIVVFCIFRFFWKIMSTPQDLKVLLECQMEVPFHSSFHFFTICLLECVSCKRIMCAFLFCNCWNIFVRFLSSKRPLTLYVSIFKFLSVRSLVLVMLVAVIMIDD